jgi:hypothetical protein
MSPIYDGVKGLVFLDIPNGEVEYCSGTSSITFVAAGSPAS